LKNRGITYWHLLGNAQAHLVPCQALLVWSGSTVKDERVYPRPQCHRSKFGVEWRSKKNEFVGRIKKAAINITRMLWRRSYLIHRNPSSHRRKNAEDIVCLEFLNVQSAGQVPNPKAGYNFVHHSRVMLVYGVIQEILGCCLHTTTGFSSYCGAMFRMGFNPANCRLYNLKLWSNYFVVVLMSFQLKHTNREIHK